MAGQCPSGTAPWKGYRMSRKSPQIGVCQSRHLVYRFAWFCALFGPVKGADGSFSGVRCLLWQTPHGCRESTITCVCSLENGHSPHQKTDIFHMKKRTFPTSENGHNPQEKTDIFHIKKRTQSTRKNGHGPHEETDIPGE